MRIVGIDTDITEIKQDEEKLAQLNYKFELAIDASDIGIWEFDLKTSRVHWDDRLLEIYGLEPGKMIVLVIPGANLSIPTTQKGRSPTPKPRPTPARI